MADDGAEMLPTLSSKITAGQPLTAGETLRLTERSASVLNEYRKLCCDDEAFGEAAREEARRRYVAAFALITARSTGSFEHRAEAARKAVLGDGAPPSPTPGFSGAALLFVCGLVGGLLNSWMAVGPDVRTNHPCTTGCRLLRSEWPSSSEHRPFLTPGRCCWNRSCRSWLCRPCSARTPTSRSKHPYRQPGTYLHSPP